MKSKIKSIVKWGYRHANLSKQLYYFDEFETWNDAVSVSNKIAGDYSSDVILDKVFASTQEVRSGNALYEQDGILYYEENNNWQLISCLLYVSSKRDVGIIDIGGALGSTYFRYKQIVQEQDIKWSIVEQEKYVERGKKYIPEIDFYYTVEDATRDNNYNTLLLSGVLMYLDDAEGYLEQMLKSEFDYIIIDETAFLTKDNTDTKIMLQHVPKRFYGVEQVYPAYIFNIDKFKKIVDDNEYEIIWEWTYEGGNIPIKKGIFFEDTIDKGFLLKRKGV